MKNASLLHRRTVLHQSAAVASFNPLSIAWNMAYWASDPLWTPPADGAGVASWRDASGTGMTATQATGASQPLYRASSANFNSKPCLEFDGVNDRLGVAPGSTLTQRNEMFVVLRLLSNLTGVSTRNVIDGSSSSVRHALYTAPGQSTWRWTAGTEVISTLAHDNATHLIRIVFDTTSVFYVDSASDSSVAAGTQSLTALSIGSRYDSARYANVQIAFIGVYHGTMSAGNVTAMRSWAQSFYGTA